jgi:hypothetical protein
MGATMSNGVLIETTHFHRSEIEMETFSPCHRILEAPMDKAHSRDTNKDACRQTMTDMTITIKKALTKEMVVSETNQMGVFLTLEVLHMTTQCAMAG